MKKLIKMFMIMMVCVGCLTGCASSESAKTAFDQLMDEMFTAIENKDADSLRNCMVSTTSDEDINSLLSQDYSVLSGYEELDSVYLGEVDGKYFFNKTYYIVSNPNTTDYSDQVYTFNCVVERENGSWKLNGNQDNEEALKSLYFSTEYFGDSAKAAYESGRNVMVTNAPQIKNEDTYVLTGAINNSVLGFWQNEDGSITIGFLFSNGFDRNVSFNDGTITLTDSVLGQICEISVEPNLIVSSGHNVYQEYTVSVDQVWTGTQAWNEVTNSYHFNYD